MTHPRKFLFVPTLANVIDRAREIADDPDVPEHLRKHALDLAATVRALGEIAFRLDKQPTPAKRRRGRV